MSNDKYSTPKWILDLFKGYYDPCPITYKKGDPNGLTTEWKIYTYVNPPYSDPLPWVKKAIEESKKQKLIIMLLRADTSTKYFELCISEGEVLFFANRIKFNGSTPYFASMLVIFNGLK